MIVTRYCKRPVEVDTIQWTGSNETGQPTEHLELLSAEARAAAAEAAEHIGRAIAAFARALQPVAQAAAATLRQVDQALRAAGHTPGGKPGRRDRPAWQSPYGPPLRRKRP